MPWKRDHIKEHCSGRFSVYNLVQNFQQYLQIHATKRIIFKISKLHQGPSFLGISNNISPRIFNQSSSSPTSHITISVTPSSLSDRASSCGKGVIEVWLCKTSKGVIGLWFCKTPTWSSVCVIMVTMETVTRSPWLHYMVTHAYLVTMVTLRGCHGYTTCGCHSYTTWLPW